jgi:hypothetical protein
MAKPGLCPFFSAFVGRCMQNDAGDPHDVDRALIEV